MLDINLLNRYLLGIRYVQGTLFIAGNTTVSTIAMVPSIIQLLRFYPGG